MEKGKHQHPIKKVAENTNSIMKRQYALQCLIVFAIGTGLFLPLLTACNCNGINNCNTSVPASTDTPIPTPTPTPTPTPALTPGLQAQSVVARYYAAINSKDYQTAYNLWANYPGSYQGFANGFSDTWHDDYQLGQVVQLDYGTAQVYITLVATSTSSQRTTYQGYYIVGEQSDGSWKIVTASMSRA
jgi:hypothetical protein